MTIHVPQPSPFAGGVRWTVASTASVAHFNHGAILANEAPLPAPVADALMTAPRDNWSSLQDLFGAILVNLPQQLIEAAWHYPLGAIAVLWWGWESLHLLRALVRQLVVLVRHVRQVRLDHAKRRKPRSGKASPRRPPRARERGARKSRARPRRRHSAPRRERGPVPKRVDEIGDGHPAEALEAHRVADNDTDVPHPGAGDAAGSEADAI